MNQTERRIYLIRELLKEQPGYQNTEIPADTAGQKSLLRSLFNIRMPGEISEEFLRIQDEYLQEETAEKGVIGLEELSPVSEDLYLWQGDITTLRCDAIVNAANSGMTGCYIPCHACIDNCIHTFAGVQLRLSCAEQMRRQGRAEDTGKAKITPAFNLSCKYVLHTVGPIISGSVTDEDDRLLASCYRSCLELAEQYNVKSIAFCCISTGVFHFPNDRAARIAVKTVRAHKARAQSDIKVIFNVFKSSDYEIYQDLMGGALKPRDQAVIAGK